jgi:hypothetical protein
MTMTTRPTSHLIHSGFLDILSLIPESTQSHPQSRVQVQVQREGRAPVPPKKTEDDLRQILRDHANVPPRTPRKEKKQERRSVEVGLRKRKVDKEMIGPPMDFRWVMFPSLSLAYRFHIPHSSMAEVGADSLDMYSTLPLMRKLLNYYWDGQ